MDTKGGTCPICFEPLNDKTIGSPDVCDHKFCFTCLEKWTKHGNFCPVDRQKFKKIISGDEVFQIKYKRKKERSALYDMSVFCEICKDVKENNDTVLLCDSCDLAYHLDCLNPPLKSVPSGNWYCPDCREVGKKLKSQKTKHSGKLLPHKTSTNSKQSSSLFHHHLTSPTKKTDVNKVSCRIHGNKNFKFAETKSNTIKQSDPSKIDYYQKNLCWPMTVNSPEKCTKTPPGEFEDFFSIFDNDVILTKRKPLNTEAKSFNENICKESGASSSVDSRQLRHVKKSTRNSSTTLQTERTKRLAAAIARNKINQNLKKNTVYPTDDSSSSSLGQYSNAETDSLENAAFSSSEQYSNAETDSLENAPFSTSNRIADIEKSVLSGQICTFPFSNINATNYIEEFSLSKPKFMNGMGLEVIEKENTLMENLNKSAAPKSSSVGENLTANAPDLVTEDLNRLDFLTTPENSVHKASPTSTKINNSVSGKLSNAQIYAMSESINNENITNYTDKFLLSEPKSINEMDLEDSEGKKTLIDNLNKSASPKSSVVCENLTTFTNAKSSASVSEVLNRIDFLTTSEKIGCKASPIRTKITDSMVGKLSNAQICAMSESSDQNNVTHYIDEFSFSKPKSINEIGLEGIDGKNTAFEHLNKNSGLKSSGVCENLTIFTNANSSDSVIEDLNRTDFLCSSETAGCKISPTSIKINNSKAEKLNNTKIDTKSKSLSVIEEPVITSTNCKSLRVNEKSRDKRTQKESRTKSGVDSRVLRRKLRRHLTEMRTKRLAAANARKKLAENFKSSSDESSIDESSDSLDQHNIAENGTLEKPPLNTSNHNLFKDTEKALSHQNSPLLFENDGYSSSESVFAISASESPGGIEENNTAIEDLNRSAASKSFSVCENSITSSIPKVFHSVKEDLNKIEHFNVFEKQGCKSSAASIKIKNSVAEKLKNVQIHAASESFSVFEKPTVKEPPELKLEPLNYPEKLGNEIPPELSLEPLNIIGNHENEIFHIIKEPKTEPVPSIVDEFKYGSFSSAFSVFEKIADTSGSPKKQSSWNRTSNGETHSHMEDCQNANNLENDGLSQGINNSDMEVDGEENIIDAFHIRQVHYAIKAKMNLPSELQKIERETWSSHQSKSSKKYKYKSSCKEAEIHISSSSHHQIVSGNEQLYNFFQSSHLDCNKSTSSEKDLTECNKFNPFCESASSTRPKKLYKVTEYNLQSSDKRVCFNKIPKNVLQSITGPFGLKHLDIREDGTLFLNWAKSKSP